MSNGTHVRDWLRNVLSRTGGLDGSLGRLLDEGEVENEAHESRNDLDHDWEETESDLRNAYTDYNRPPLLADPRPRPLTPTPSEGVPSQPQSVLLSKIPSDVRRDILEMALGNRTVHVDLIYDYPISTDPRKASGDGESACAALRFSSQRPRRWIWAGSVCQRNAPDVSVKDDDWGESWEGPWTDKCPQTSEEICTVSRSDQPNKYRIGAMGWLRSCRQAYLEGIEVLYETNTMHIRGSTLAANINRLMLPQRLSSVRYLELSFTAYLNLSGDDNQGQTVNSMGQALQTVLVRMPALKRVYVSFECDIIPSTGRWSPPFYSWLMRDMDAFVRNQLHNDPGLERPCTLALPRTVTLPVSDEARRVPAGGTQVSDEELLLWRCLDGPQPVTELRSGAPYPNAPPKGPLPEQALGSAATEDEEPEKKEDDDEYSRSDATPEPPEPSLGYWMVEAASKEPPSEPWFPETISEEDDHLGFGEFGE